ncbi:MAG: hypothetical protein WCO00_04730 [Rhodospirillaceae bacterium]
MLKNFSATTRALEKDRLIAPLALLGTAIGLALLWLWWFCNPTLPVYLISRQVYFNGEHNYDTVVALKDGAYSNRQVKRWVIYADFPPDQRGRIEKGQAVAIRPPGAAIAGNGVLRGEIAETPARRDRLVRILVTTDIDRTVSPSAIGEVRVKIAMRAPIDYVLSGSGLATPGERQVPDRP